MRLPLACALCAALVAVDVLVRAVRLQWLLRGAGHRLRLPALCESILFGDAAAATTPMRLGGEPARWLGLMGGGVPARVAAAVLALEMATYLSIVALSGIAAAWTMGGAWWEGVGPRLAARAGDVLPWAAAVGAASVWLWIRVRRRRGPRADAPPAPALAPGALAWPVAAAVPLTLVSIGARLGMLPVLAQTLPEPPPLGVLVLGSFALVYGQLFFPTPGGAGAVELLAAAGTAGELGGSGGAVFLAWRAVTTGLPVVLGYGLALRRYGGAAVRNVIRGHRPAGTPAEPA